MKEIVVLSGKGGTGKTSITASLAVLAGSEAVVADCDVDAANMHLLMQPDFALSSEFYSGELAIIDQNACTQCGVCSEKCRFGAIPFINNIFIVNPLSCEGCGYCQKVCPTEAISMKSRKSGYVYISNTKVNSTMVHARLDIGAENSGKLVAKVKNEAKELAKQQNKSFVIVDGSPGIGCPVVSSLSGANYVVLVTEPTVSGLHDLERIYSVIKRFRINAGCIINKFDINPKKTDEIIEFLRKENITHLSNIPFDIRFTKAMTEAKTIVELETLPKYLIKDAWFKIKDELTNN
ncbi:MAG TPA: ATP-binding protein [Tenuifilaceae bacterium]|nr:ATP-binding protein [Tenuifilaceae bacterium]HOZ14175.1 ATP-binding protein [Tenuifilaceae bacterium]HPI43651.1 ATP-binding protein [Tenuifilaceae bacterium]HPN21092.1 ATP-binding protein [Tenuifilaceae bacterium]